MSTESWTVTAAQHVDIAEAGTLVVGLNSGDIEIVADPARTYGAAIDITEISDRPLQITSHQGELRIAYDYAGLEGLVDRVRGLRDKDRAVVKVVVAATTHVRVTTARATVRVTGVCAPVDVTTANGAVHAQGVTGPLTVHTASGDVDCVEHVGDARINTGAGAIALAGALGRITARSVSGAVRITAQGSTPLVSVQTVSGALAVELGEGTPVNLRVKSVSGRVVLDGAVVPSQSQHTTSVNHVDEHGRAGVYLSATTVSGDIEVTRV